MDVHQTDKSCTLVITTKLPTANCALIYITRKRNLLVTKGNLSLQVLLIIAVNVSDKCVGLKVFERPKLLF